MPQFFSFKSEARQFQRAFTEALRAVQADSTGRFLSADNILKFNHGRSWINPASAGDREGSLQAFSSVWETSYQDIVDGNLDILLKSLHGISSDLERQFMGVMYSTISSACDESGRTIDATAMVSPAEAFLEALKAIEFGVDRHGNVALPQLHVHPDTADKLLAELHSQSTEFQEEFERVKSEKIEAALQREAERKSKFKGVQ
jgi:hypothetical protein